MKLEKLNLRNQKHLDEVFKKLKSLIDEPKMYGQRSGQLIFGSIASYLFTREAQIYWDEFLLKILQIKQLEDYVSLKTANDLLKPFLENFLIGNPIQTQDFLIKIDELFQKRCRLRKKHLKNLSILMVKANSSWKK